MSYATLAVLLHDERVLASVMKGAIEGNGQREHVPLDWYLGATICCFHRLERATSGRANEQAIVNDQSLRELGTNESSAGGEYGQVKMEVAQNLRRQCSSMAHRERNAARKAP